MSENEDAGAIRLTILTAIVARFPLGQLLVTPGAEEALQASGTDLLEFVRRHAAGDWGDLSDDDRQANDAAVTEGDRILSAYGLSTGSTIWIITESDRSATTALLPDEY